MSRHVHRCGNEWCGSRDLVDDWLTAPDGRPYREHSIGAGGELQPALPRRVDQDGPARQGSIEWCAVKIETLSFDAPAETLPAVVYLTVGVEMLELLPSEAAAIANGLLELAKRADWSNSVPV